MTSRPDPSHLLELELLALEEAAGRPGCVVTRDLRLVRSSPSLPLPGSGPAWLQDLAEPVARVCASGQAEVIQAPQALLDHGLPPLVRLLPLVQGAPEDRQIPGIRLEFLHAADTAADRAGDPAEHARRARLQCLGVLAGGMAHQFNNLLLGILGHSELLARQCTDPAAGEQLDPIRQSALRARDLTREVLGLLECRTPRRVPLDLDAFLDSFDRKARFGLPPGVRVRNESGPRPTRVLADPDHLLLILLACLLETARGLEGEGAGVLLSHGSSPGTSGGWITVTSGGPRPRDPFPTDSPLLAEARRSAAVLDGHLETGQDADGQRVCRLHLPAASALPANGHREQLLGDPQEGAGCSVLVIDDEAGVREVLAKLLQTRGYRVLTADSGPQGLDLLVSEAHPVDLVLLDLSMPGMSGQETSRILQDRIPGLPVILMSGVDAIERQGGHFEGASAFLAKPFSIQALFGVLRSVRGQLGQSANGHSLPEGRA